MDRKQEYFNQVGLLTKILPLLNSQPQFALKGGTAINLFIRNLPRLSVDIDLVYLPLDERSAAIANIQNSLDELALKIERMNLKVVKAYKSKEDAMRLNVSDNRVSVKVELSPVMRGTVHQKMMAQACDKVQEQFGLIEVPLVSFEDLYAGKICAALARQHPRDLYDVKVLLENEGLTDSLRVTTIIYLLCNNRPLAELLAPNLKDLTEVFHDQFVDMTEDVVNLAELVATRERLINELTGAFTENERAFMVSFKQCKPNWTLLNVDTSEVDKLPAVQWKLLNLGKMATDKHKLAIEKLQAILNV